MSGHTFGILINFDLAGIVDVLRENNRRTGTQPFMAIDCKKPKGQSSAITSTMLNRSSG